MKSLILCVLIVTSSVVSQTLHGIVYGKGADGNTAPISGARVQWKGTQMGTLTRSDGSFTLKRAVDTASVDTLIISAIGYRSDTLVVPRTQEHLEHTLRAEFEARTVQVEGEATSIAAAEPIRTELVTRRQLEQSACCTLAESFERSPSVEVQYSDAALGAKTIRLLGLRGLYTTGLTEAVPLMRGVTGAFALDDIPGPFIDGISIAKGAASVLNGYDGITGQINIEYKKPQRDVPFFANAFANHLGRAELNLTSAQQLSSSLHSMVMLHGRMFQRDVDANGDGFLDMPRFGNINGIARLIWQEDNREFQIVLRPTWGTYRGGSMPALSANGSGGYRIETITSRLEGYAKLAFNELGLPLADRIGLQLGLSQQHLSTTAGLRSITANETFAVVKLIAALEPTEHVRFHYGASLFYDQPDEQLDSLHRTRREVVPGAFLEATFMHPSLTATVGVRSDWHNLFGWQITPRLHLKYNLTELVALRFSAGSGLRVPLMIADNVAAFLNNRRIVLDSVVLPERAVNVGGAVTATLPLGERAITLDAEFYHTRFSRQLVTDFDRSARELAIMYASQGYANSALAQLSTTLFPRFDLTIAYRLMDTYLYTGGALRLQPLVSPHRVLVAASYLTENRVWEFNVTAVWYSSGRIPTTQENPPAYRFEERFPSYIRAGMQINYRPDGGPEFYVGVENLANVLQPRAVLAADSPTSPYFDASLVWGPLDQRTVYAGIRWRVGEPWEE